MILKGSKDLKEVLSYKKEMTDSTPRAAAIIGAAAFIALGRCCHRPIITDAHQYE